MTHLGAKSVAEYAKKKLEEQTERFTASLWECHPIGEENRKIYIETTRWYDARAYAIRHFGCVDATARGLETLPSNVKETIQLREVGSPMSQANPKRWQMRVAKNGIPQTFWNDVG